MRRIWTVRSRWGERFPQQRKALSKSGRFWRSRDCRDNYLRSRFGSDNTIWLKAKRNFPVLPHTLSYYSCLVRVHAFVARELPLLQSQNLSLRFSASSVQSVQAHVENSQETSRRQSSSRASYTSESCVGGRTHTENSRATLWSYASGIESALSSNAAPVRVAISRFPRIKGTIDSGAGRTLFSLPR